MIVLLTHVYRIDQWWKTNTSMTFIKHQDWHQTNGAFVSFKPICLHLLRFPRINIDYNPFITTFVQSWAESNSKLVFRTVVFSFFLHCFFRFGTRSSTERSLIFNAIKALRSLPIGFRRFRSPACDACYVQLHHWLLCPTTNRMPSNCGPFNRNERLLRSRTSGSCRREYNASKSPPNNA